MSILTYLFQDNKTAGAFGMGLVGINILYNGFMWYFIYKKKPVRILSYIMMTLNVLSLTVYNYFDATYNSPVLTATSAAILIYPILMFLASLRMDRVLVWFTTLLSCTMMNLLYFRFYSSFHLGMAETKISADWISQGFRTVFLVVLGYLITTVPASMRRILAKQDELRKEGTLHKMKAQRDPLTSLYNRYFLEEYFNSSVENNEEPGRKYALLYIDLNDFKIMNDTHGHDFGDFVLKSVGEDLKRAVRDGDIVARIGGDELVVLFQLESNTEVVKALAQRISDAIKRPRTFNGITISVKASIGVSLFPDQAADMEELLKRADQAMYKIKKEKKHGVAFA